MRGTPEGIVEELRDQARDDAHDLGVPVEEVNAWEAAAYIEYLRAYLARISAGETEPAVLAAEALDVRLWMFSGG